MNTTGSTVTATTISATTNKSNNNSNDYNNNVNNNNNKKWLCITKKLKVNIYIVHLIIHSVKKMLLNSVFISVIKFSVLLREFDKLVQIIRTI